MTQRVAACVGLLFSIVALAAAQTTSVPLSLLWNNPEDEIVTQPLKLTAGVYAVFHTTDGDFIVQLYRDKAPKTVENFIGLATGKKPWTHPITQVTSTKPLYNNTQIYRIVKGKAEEYFEPGTAYIWSLAFGRDGALYAGTGADGKVFRITGPGKGELWYQTGQSHVTCLALDAKDQLLAGTEPNGIIYRISAKDRGFVLFDADLPEIRTLVPAPDGSVYQHRGVIYRIDADPT